MTRKCSLAYYVFIQQMFTKFLLYGKHFLELEKGCCFHGVYVLVGRIDSKQTREVLENGKCYAEN